MRIEVLIGNGDPVIYPLKSSKVTLGSAENSDIVVEADGVSRKHITIITEGDNYFVIDQGSTNGSFINEERLVPGRKTEFTSFFPVRLGAQVLLSLVSDEEGISSLEIPSTFREKTGSDIKINSSTKVLPLSELNKVKTETLLNQRNKKRSGASSPREIKKPEKKRKTFNPVPYFVVLMIGTAGYYNFNMVQDMQGSEEVAKVGELVPVEASPSQEIPEPLFLIPESELANKDNYSTLIDDLKCTTDVEKYLCDNLPGAKDDRFGVVQVGLTLHVLVNGDPYLHEARNTVRRPEGNRPELLEDYEKLVSDTALFIYLMQMNRNLDESMMKDMRISIALYESFENGFRIRRVAALKPDVFKELDKVLTRETLTFVRRVGDAALYGTRQYYRTY